MMMYMKSYSVYIAAPIAVDETQIHLILVFLMSRWAIRWGCPVRQPQFCKHFSVWSRYIKKNEVISCIAKYYGKVTLYGWWLLEEGTSRNVPIAGFEMILREDYKSRDEVEGLIFFPKYHFKPQDTGNIPWCSRQQSRHLLYCMATHCPHCLARLRHSSQKFTKLSIFFSGDFL